MATQMLQKFWALVREQHGVVTRRQLLELGFSADAIRQRVRNGRLHPLWTGVYAVGRPEVSTHGRWMAAVLACGPAAVLSHGSAAALWRLGDYEQGSVEVSVPASVCRRRPGIRVHRRADLSDDTTTQRRIPVTSPVLTVIDMAARLTDAGLERLINEGANRHLFTPDELRLAAAGRRRGAPRIRRVLDRQTFRLTRSELERRFLRVVREARLPIPQTRAWLNGFEVDFYFEDLGLVVETDGLRYHRTPAQQARDRLRDQAHLAAGLTPLRFTHGQIRYQPAYVAETLRRVASALESAARRSSLA